MKTFIDNWVTEKSIILHFFTITMNHRMTKCLRLEGTCGGHLVQPPCSSRATYSWRPRTVPKWLLNISKDGDSTASLGSLCQCLVPPTVRKCFLMFRENLPCFSSYPKPNLLPLDTTEESLAPSPLHPPFKNWYTSKRSPLWAFFSPDCTAPALSASPHKRDTPVLLPF